MPTTLRCPHCRAKITVRQSPTRKPIICANCERKFTPLDDDDEPDAVDDESPRSRRRDEDDEVELPRNRKVRRGKRKKKKRGDPLRILLPLGGLAFAGVIGLVLYLFVFRPGGKDADGNPAAAKELPDADLLAWVPADSSMVSFVNYRALAYLQTSPFNPYQHTVLVPNGLDPSDFDAAVHASGLGTPGAVFALRLKTPNPEGIDQAMARLGGPVKIGDQTVYKAQRYAMYRASDRILVVSERRDYLEGRVGSKSRSVVIGGSILDYVSRASADAWNIHVAVGQLRISGFPALSSMATLQVREDSALYTSDITYTDEATASQAADRNRAAGLEVQQTGQRVIYRRSGVASAAGVGIGGLHWRW
jgi:hypothetical protein